ncbi:hypothetical protein P8452_47574 [Trifolium repens]|nr:hypothetical protein P8452_47574 [Trifolium repens]
MVLAKKTKKTRESINKRKIHPRWIETVADNYPPPLDNYLILKHEWPARWRSFIPDLVSGAKTSEACSFCHVYVN